MQTCMCFYCALVMNITRCLLFSPTVRSIRNIYHFSKKEKKKHTPEAVCSLSGSFWPDSGSVLANAKWGREPKLRLSQSQESTEPVFSWCPQRLLPIDGANDLFYQPPPSLPTTKLYSIRPYYPKDEVRSFFLLCNHASVQSIVWLVTHQSSFLILIMLRHKKCVL